MISFLQLEKRHLNVNKLLLTKPKEYLEVEDGKGKSIIYAKKLEDREVPIKPRRPRTRNIKRQKEQESEPSPSLGQLDFDELITTEIEQDKEFWLGKVNDQLEKLLKRDNRNTNLQRHMERHYCTRNKHS